MVIKAFCRRAETQCSQKDDPIGETVYFKGGSAMSFRARFFYPQFWNKDGWYGMLGIIRIVCIKKPPSVLAE